MDEFNAGVVTGDVDVAVGVGGETAGERREMGEDTRKTAFEKKDKVGNGDWRASEEVAFLNVVAGEHREVGDGEFEVREGGFRGGEDGGFGEDLN